MDVIVAPAGEHMWELADLLGRSAGRIVEDVTGFMIEPDGHVLETIADMDPGPYASLDAALFEIEKHTRGVCRHAPSSGRAHDI